MRGESPLPDHILRCDPAPARKWGEVKKGLLPSHRTRIELGLALGLLGELGRERRGLLRRAPARGIAAVAPGFRPIEGVDAELVHPLHFGHPGWVHVVGVIVGRLADLLEPDLAVEHRLGDLKASAQWRLGKKP